MLKPKNKTYYVAVVVNPSRMHGFTEAGDIVLVTPGISNHSFVAWNGVTLFAVVLDDVEVIETFNEPI